MAPSSGLRDSGSSQQAIADELKAKAIARGAANLESTPGYESAPALWLAPAKGQFRRMRNLTPPLAEKIP